MAMKLSFSPCGPEEMSTDDIISILTPKMKSNVFMDDSEGKCTRFQNEHNPTPELFCPRRSLFPGQCKRQRPEDIGDNLTPRCFRRALSMGDSPLAMETDSGKNSHVIAAVNRFAEDTDLVGDGSGAYHLPTIPGKHSDLKSISAQTMADLLNGQYEHCINSFRIIDCRYPYEFHGGHIHGAENLYTQEQINGLLDGRTECQNNMDTKPDILIFHCEFSSERGPKMSRFLRKQDREQNKANYPSLCYPEVYLLDGGYKTFYQSQHQLCSPMAYIPMLHKDHSEDLRHFRAKSKSWTIGQRQRKPRRNLKI